MPLPATGFLTNDGVFFIRAADARKHEAEMQLRLLCTAHRPKPIDPEKFLETVEAMSREIGEYIDALKAQDRETASPNPIAGSHPSDQRGREGFNASVEQLKAERLKPVLGMGDSSQPETVQDERARNGFRSGGDNAPSLRSSEDLAVAVHSAFAETRDGNSLSDIRKRTLDEDTERGYV